MLALVALVALGPSGGRGGDTPAADLGRPGPPSAGQVATDEGGHTVTGPTGQEYVTFGTTWTGPVVTYGFVNHTTDLTVAGQEAAIEAALATWASVVPLRFERVADCGYDFNDSRCPSPDIRVSFGTGSHAGSGDPAFDGPGGTVAHAYYPPPNGITAAGDAHFDDAEWWTTTGGGVDLESIALHELGHSLGLAHATAATCAVDAGANRSIMCPYLLGIDRTLAPDDVICGGRGADRLRGGRGGDVLRGGGGPDTLTGGPGTDQCIGGKGADLASSCEARTGVP